WADVGGVDLDADGLANQVDAEYQARMRALADQPSDDALERSMDDLDHHALADHRAGIVGKIALDQLADAFDFVLGNRGGLALKRDDVHHAHALEDRQAVARIEAREAVAGEQRPVDLLLAVLPPAPLRDRGQEGFDLLLFELFPNHLLVARARPQREPRRACHASTLARHEPERRRRVIPPAPSAVRPARSRR